MSPRVSAVTSHARSNRSGKPARHAAPARRVVRVFLAGDDSGTNGPSPGRETAPTPAGRPRLVGLPVATPWHP